MASESKEDFHVLIVGAGTSGLLVAQGCQKASIPFTIFETETTNTYQTRPREWGMTLHWGAKYIASCLPPELVARFNESYADPAQAPDAVTGLPIYNGKTGELIMEMASEKPCRVSRRKMRNLFKQGIHVEYGKKLKRAYVSDDGKAHAEFEDGTTAIGDVLVGCDGAKSRVRENIVGAEAAALTNSHVSMFNFPHKFDSELAKNIRDRNKLFITSVHPDHGTMFWLSIQDVPDPSKPETWTFQVLQSWVDSTVPSSADLSTFEGRMAFFKKRSEGYAEPWRSVGRAVSPDTKILLDQGTYWEKASKWDNREGRLTLCGDAAHPMTPHRGQGLNNALMDSANFVAALLKVQSGEKTMAQAVQEYDDEVLERGCMEMNISLKQTLFIHNWETLMQSPMVKMGMRPAKKEDGAIAQ